MSEVRKSFVQTVYLVLSDIVHPDGLHSVERNTADAERELKIREGLPAELNRGLRITAGLLTYFWALTRPRRDAAAGPPQGRRRAAAGPPQGRRRAAAGPARLRHGWPQDFLLPRTAVRAARATSWEEPLLAVVLAAPARPGG